MKKRMAVLMLFGVIVALALVTMAPGASASMVTKVMLAQENTTVFEWTATFTGDVWVQVSWLDSAGNASSFPISEVDGGINGPKGAALYTDYDVGDLYAGTNPVSAYQAVASGKKYYFTVYPYVDDCTATIDVRQTDENGVHITCSKMGVDGSGNTTRTTVTMPQTVAVYASDGEFYLPSAGNWISVLQYWLGTSAGTNYACWNDYVYERVAGSDYDTLSEAWDTIYWPTQVPARVAVNAAGGADPAAGKWYSVTPEVWPSRSVPNVGTNADAQPGSIDATKAPLWYTYAFNDSAVATQAPGYFWGTLTNAGASKRNYSTNVSTAASFGCAFSGDTITWVFTKNSNAGIARVRIDGVDKGTVDQYAASRTFKQTAVFSGLGAGNHAIVVTNNGTKNASSTNTAINHDSFLAKGINDAADPTPYMENNYDGSTWFKQGTLSNAGASGGNYSTTVSTAAVFAMEFSGTSITWKYVTNTNCGRALVYIDGVLKETVDQYSTPRTFGVTKTYSGLSNTTHIIMIANAGTKNASSTNTSVTHDAFIVGATTIEN